MTAPGKISADIGEQVQSWPSVSDLPKNQLVVSLLPVPWASETDFEAIFSFCISILITFILTKCIPTFVFFRSYHSFQFYYHFIMEMTFTSKVRMYFKVFKCNFFN